nr:type VI secretion system tip protein VgrG [uncultured Psychroserpens sp.]
MAETLRQPEGIISFQIKINGTNIRDIVKVKNIAITMEVNKIASATIVIQEDFGKIDSSKAFSNSESNDFIPGNDIEIALGYNSKNESVFKGIIVTQQIKSKEDNFQLIVICHDKAIKLTKSKHNALFQDMQDADVLKSIADAHALKLDIDNTSIKHPVLMQYNCNDWDYLISRAEANNMLVYNYQNKLSIKNIDFNIKPEYVFKVGENVIEFDLKLESEHLSTAYNMTSWNSKTQDLEKSTVISNKTLKQGNITSKKLSEVMDTTTNMYSPATLHKDEMKLLLESKQCKAELSKFQGNIKIVGTSKIIAGDFVEFSNFSKRYNGNAFISKVVHSLEDGDWFTELTVGKKEDFQTSKLLPVFTGTQIAKVKQIHQDPEDNYRVLVSIPASEDMDIWARISIPYASANAGFFFFPEVGDEVLLSFMNNDPRFPIITGSLYSAKNKPRETPNETNQFKSIYSKSGIEIKFDDVDEILTIQTPGNNTILLDDKNRKISIKDRHDNAIIMDETGIVLKSSKDINIEAMGNINIDANSKLKMKVKGDATLEATNIMQKARTEFKANGSASAEISADGQTTVKGAIVMIN